ncbi:unnamed protein product [Closterium sp. Yama58-4]|nr:unnamed protein product [Closterium sp. Yama58-4]
MSITTRAALSAALLATFVALLAPPRPFAAAQSAFLIAKAKTLRAVADQTAANLTAAQADAARCADEVANATQALADLLAPDTVLSDRISSIADMNVSLANAQNELNIANKTLAQRIADLKAYNDDPSSFPQIPAAQKAVEDATRRANTTSAMVAKWQSIKQDAVQAVADAERAVAMNPNSTAAQVVLSGAQASLQNAAETYADMVAQDQRAQARLARAQQDLNALQQNPPLVDVNVFPKAVDDARAAVSVARQVYDSIVATITDAQNALNQYKAAKAKAIADAKTRLAKAKQSQAVADKKVLQLTDKLKVAQAQADNAEIAAGIIKPAPAMSKTAVKRKYKKH